MLTQSSQAIEVCKKHLTEYNAFGTEIESYLVRYLLVVMCAEIETLILRLVVERATRSGDVQVASFVNNVATRAFRRVRTGEMSSLLKNFDPTMRDQFKAKVDKTSEQVAFDNIINNRHDMAHGRATVNMTFTDLFSDFEKCKVILTHFSDTLQ